MILDTEGLAIIMCEPELVSKYQALTQGRTVLESSLHHNMLEHLNSEIALGTITNTQSAKNWLRGSFLYQRLQKNPDHYALEQQMDRSWQEKLDVIVLENINRLESTNLIQRRQEGESEELASTEYGDIMAKVFNYGCPGIQTKVIQFPSSISANPRLVVLLWSLRSLTLWKDGKDYEPPRNMYFTRNSTSLLVLLNASSSQDVIA